MINMLAYFKGELKWKALDKELKKIVFLKEKNIICGNIY